MMGLFAKKAEPSTEVALYQPIQPSAAPKATGLEQEIRSKIWIMMSPELSHAAGLSLSELINYTSGVRRLLRSQIEAPARKMGLVEDLPPTGVDHVRSKLRVMMKKWANFAAHIEWRGSPQALQDFIDGEALTHEDVAFLARALFGKEVSVSESGEMHRPPHVAIAFGPSPGRWAGGSNICGQNARALAFARQRVAELAAEQG